MRDAVVIEVREGLREEKAEEAEETEKKCWDEWSKRTTTLLEE